jgi:hypothetical protein
MYHDGLLDHHDQSEQSDKDSNVQLKSKAEKATKKEDSRATNPCSKVIPLHMFPIGNLH